MTSRIAVISVDAIDPTRVAEFWCAALGWELHNLDATGADIGPPDGSWPTIEFGRVPEEKAVKNRLHLDLRADGTTQRDELHRLLDLGARMVDVGRRPAALGLCLLILRGMSSVCYRAPSRSFVKATK
jgi:hypothetical protein